MSRFLDAIVQRRHNHDTFARYVVDVERHPELARQFDVAIVPTIVVVDDGRTLARVEGRATVPELRRALTPWLR